MAIARKVLYGMDKVISNIKSWANSTFAAKSHTHTSSDISLTSVMLHGKVVSKSLNDFPTSWYIVYEDGWIEQGGQQSYTVSNKGYDVTGTTTMPKGFKSTNYLILVSLRLTCGGSGSISAYQKSTTVFSWQYDHTGSDSIHTGEGNFLWTASGY